MDMPDTAEVGHGHMYFMNKALKEMLHLVDNLQLKIRTQEYIFHVKWRHPSANRDSIRKIKILV